MNTDFEPYTQIVLYAWDGDRKINAIKQIRALTKMISYKALGLKDAKAVVDHLQARTKTFDFMVETDATGFVKTALKDAGFSTEPRYAERIDLTTYNSDTNNDW